MRVSFPSFTRRTETFLTSLMSKSRGKSELAGNRSDSSLGVSLSVIEEGAEWRDMEKRALEQAESSSEVPSRSIWSRQLSRVSSCTSVPAILTIQLFERGYSSAV